MRKRTIICLLLMSFLIKGFASHITGGEMYYKFNGVSNGLYNYTVTLRLLQRCNSGRNFPNPAVISIFNKTTNTRVLDQNANMTNQETIQITNPDPCISNPPQVCYEVAYYTFDVSLPESADGYVMASQVNYRINGINNLEPGYNNIGATYTAEIPGNGFLPNAAANNSAAFTGTDLVIVCANNEMRYSFAAQDADGDELHYSFCDAFASTSSGGGNTPTNPPPFPPVPYNQPGFDASMPLGSGVQIDPNTGLLTGIAPEQGIYVITVCVEEVRNGVVIARQRKDVQINIADCNIASASLLPEYMLCKNSQTLTIANQSSSPLIVTTDWEFLDAAQTIIYATNTTVATYTFPAPGLYTVKLVINRDQGCTDSTTALVRVFPGFMPDFSATGICITKPTFFTDHTTSVYGTPNSWSWDFGEQNSNTDISSLQHPSYTYPTMGVKNIRLIATDTRGCRDTVIKSITIIDKPPVTMAFHDTLICLHDVLMLQAIGNGNFTWSPLVNITNANTATPTVSPTGTTTYYADLDDNGCKNRDSVKVNVVDHVTLQVMNDTTICKGDTIQLRVQSDGLRYSWAPAAQFVDPLVKFPLAITHSLTDYVVTAIIGGCRATASIRVTPVPYPQVNAGFDQTICYNASTQLIGNTDGSSWSWSPAAKVNNPLLLNPVAFPSRTTDFILTAYDTRGCPKPGRDTVTITVLPKLRISAGNDTAVVVGQPLQLHATGGVAYLWIPGTYLSAADVADPVANFPLPVSAMKYKIIGFNSHGCQDSGYIKIDVYKSEPIVFVPSGFTPNNDGLNDLLVPVAAGMKKIEYFSVYNRWGQLVFSTTSTGHGWDGKIGGVEQAPATYVWQVKAIDYLGRVYFQKGLTTLIR